VSSVSVSRPPGADHNGSSALRSPANLRHRILRTGYCAEVLNATCQPRMRSDDDRRPSDCGTARILSDGLSWGTVPRLHVAIKLIC
jgi:hypothetical protein